MTKYKTSVSNKSKSRPRRKHQRYSSRGAKATNKKPVNKKVVTLDVVGGKDSWKKNRDTKAWWRSLTAEQQADYVYNLMLAKHGKADWQKEYDRVIKQGLYLK